MGQHLATGFVIGTRFHSAPVLRLADARPLQLGHAGQAERRWRLYAFADTDGAGLRALCDFLEQAADSLVVRPDHYIAHVLPLHAQAALAAFFGRFMLEGAP